ncbi:MAG: Mut7-C RNAse domain-containing protein [Candidatus Saliniplasma sp.]
MTKFLVDRMLGQTTKWLRFMGIDAKYAPKGDDEKLLEIAEKEDRVIITRDKELASNENVLLVEKAPPEDIIPKILKIYNTELKPLTRCSNCNSLVEKIEKEKIVDKVPRGVLERKDEFWICKECDKVYWKGTHWENILDKIEKMNKKV